MPAGQTDQGEIRSASDYTQLLGLPATWPHVSDNAAFPPGALGPVGLPPLRVPLLWPPE